MKAKEPVKEGIHPVYLPIIVAPCHMTAPAGVGAADVGAQCALTLSGREVRNPRHTPFVLLALLLLPTLPLLLTLQKLVELLRLGERSHHQFAEPEQRNNAV